MAGGPTVDERGLSPRRLVGEQLSGPLAVLLDGPWLRPYGANSTEESKPAWTCASSGSRSATVARRVSRERSTAATRASRVRRYQAAPPARRGSPELRRGRPASKPLRRSCRVKCRTRRRTAAAFSQFARSALSIALAVVRPWPAMDTAEIPQPRTDTPEDLASAATAPARWLLETAGNGGVPLTQTYAFARSVVREVAERWPGWWDAELFGTPNREADMALLEELREGVLRKRLVRRRGSKLLATSRGKTLASDPIALLYELSLDLGGGDLFTSMVAGVVVDELENNAPRSHDQLVKPAHDASRWGWRAADGGPPSEQGVSWVVSDVLCRGEAYGLIERSPDPDKPKSWRALISLTPAANLVLGERRQEVSGRTVFLFEAELQNVNGVSATVAVAGHEHLTALHDSIRHAFNWEDDHLYSF